jgi:hypothetical protein
MANFGLTSLGSSQGSASGLLSNTPATNSLADVGSTESFSSANGISGSTNGGFGASASVDFGGWRMT